MGLLCEFGGKKVDKMDIIRPETGWEEKKDLVHGPESQVLDRTLLGRGKRWRE